MSHWSYHDDNNRRKRKHDGRGEWTHENESLTGVRNAYNNTPEGFQDHGVLNRSMINSNMEMKLKLNDGGPRKVKYQPT
jgi:hypothetical protein